ncbi:MAG: cysteinyl-tRNA synthetase [Chloroflexota bacterium]|nr:cysteinyl-tRNA synthetase [Dehalococcoidia bacterium]MDW8253383.1 cysteinyl-tRNA synthetase [Chloroflexota bacterium]
MTKPRAIPIPPQRPGPLVFFGSMEMTLTGRKVHDALWRGLDRPIRVAILETPAGFELNSADVAGRYAKFLRERLQPYAPQVVVIPARKRGTPFSPDDPAICAPMLKANYFYLGAGSPTYTVRQLRDSLAWRYLMVRHRMGAPICFESAASLAVSRYTMPIYEIYKVGEDPHWKDGLDLLAQYGLSVTFVPHWNNTDGGAALDTSRCYIGRERFEAMCAMLPPGHTIVGIDDHTALIIEVAEQRCRVMGLDTVTILREGKQTIYRAGDLFPLSVLGEGSLPADLREGIDPALWDAALAALAEPDAAPQPDATVQQLVQARAAARAARDWATADRLRAEIVARGWWVDDTPTGPLLRPRETSSRSP